MTTMRASKAAQQGGKRGSRDNSKLGTVDRAVGRPAATLYPVDARW